MRYLGLFLVLTVLLAIQVFAKDDHSIANPTVPEYYQQAIDLRPALAFKGNADMVLIEETRLRLQEGTVAEKPAIWLYNGEQDALADDADLRMNFFAVRLEEAKTPTDANAKCKALSPKGIWHLPDENEAVKLFFFERTASIFSQFRSPFRQEIRVSHFWMRSNDKVQLSRVLDNEAFATQKTSLSEVTQNCKDGLESVKRMNEEEALKETGRKKADVVRDFEDLLKSTQKGIHVVCVVGRSSQPEQND